jgi:outer membrane biosynthesis protein TonB
MENSSHKSVNRTLSILLLLALLLLAFLGYRMSRMSQELVDLKTLAIQMAIDRAEQKRELNKPQPAVEIINDVPPVSPVPGI